MFMRLGCRSSWIYLVVDFWLMKLERSFGLLFSPWEFTEMDSRCTLSWRQCKRYEVLCELWDEWSCLLNLCRECYRHSAFAEAMSDSTTLALNWSWKRWLFSSYIGYNRGELFCLCVGIDLLFGIVVLERWRYKDRICLKDHVAECKERWVFKAV